MWRPVTKSLLEGRENLVIGRYSSGGTTPFLAEHRTWSASFFRSRNVVGNSYPSSQVYPCTCDDSDNCRWTDGRTWKATPFLVGSSSPAGSPASRRKASQSTIELKSSSLEPLFRLISDWTERAPSGEYLPASQNPVEPDIEELFVEPNVHLRSTKVSRCSGRRWAEVKGGNERDIRVGHARALSSSKLFNKSTTTGRPPILLPIAAFTCTLPPSPISAPRASWMCPNTCNRHLSISFILLARTPHPARTLFLVSSRIRSAGVWVNRISVSLGTLE